MKVFHLSFTREADGCWYIDFPGYPLAHHNLMMVAGADRLCDYVALRQGHPDRAVVDVTLDNRLLGGRLPDIRMERIRKGYGATYRNTDPSGQPPVVTDRNGREAMVQEAWLCPVTLLVLFQYPKCINLYLPEREQSKDGNAV